MFDKDFQIRGKHASYWKSLSKTPGNAQDVSPNFKVFNRYIDVYMLAPIIGLLNNRKGFHDSSDDSKDTAGMLAEVLIKNQSKLKYIYRLIILLDDTSDITTDQKINRAFREENNEESIAEGMKIFNEYFLGGLEVLNEEFVTSCTTDDDFINRIYSFVEEFKNEQSIDSLEINVEELLRK